MNIPAIIKLQHEYFKTSKTRDLNAIRQLLKSLKTEILNREEDIYHEVYKDFRKSKFETYLSEVAIVISESSETRADFVRKAIQ